MNVYHEVTSIPSNGVLMGGRGYNPLSDGIQRALGTSNYFGSPQDRYYNESQGFVAKYIAPIREANRQVERMQHIAENPNTFITVTNNDELRYIPPVMMPSMLTYEPMYNLLQQGRIYGWGYTANDLAHDKEMYDRLIDKNGCIDSTNYEQHVVEHDGEKYTEFSYEYHDGDVYLTLEDYEAIENTREYLDNILNNTDMDPTDLDELRG